MIRLAGSADGRAMVAMAEHFHAAMVPDLPFSPLHAARTFKAALTGQNSLCLVLDVDGPKGALIVQAGEFALGPAIVAKEIVFWIEPEHRGRWFRPMLQEAERWARSVGAAYLGMSCFNDGRTVKIFERAGFAAREIVSSKRL